MPGRMGFLLVDSSFKAIFADDDVRSALTTSSDGCTSFEHGLELFLGAVETLETSGQHQKEFKFAGRQWKWTQLSYNQCPGGPQTLHAFLLEAPDKRVTYVSAVASMYRLTAREAQTLEALLQGLSIKEVATQMGINPSTVKTFLRSISGKMGVSSRAELMSRVLGLSRNESLECPFKIALAVTLPSAPGIQITGVGASGH